MTWPPMPVAGPSHHQSQTPETTEDERLKKKSKGKAPIPGVRIPWCPLPVHVAELYIQRTQALDPETSSLSEVSVIHVKLKKNKGKGRMQDHVDWETDKEKREKKRMRNPQPGELQAEPYKRCTWLKYMCFEQVRGKACLHCAKGKIRCVGQDEEDGNVTEVARPAKIWSLGQDEENGNMTEAPRLTDKVVRIMILVPSSV